MHLAHVKYSRGQLKIQEMAFVLIAIFVFFIMVALFYFSVRSASLTKDAALCKEDRTRELVRRLASSPEFSSANCKDCLDFDKALAIKEKSNVYKKFWGLDYLRIERAYPRSNTTECDSANYPNCAGVTIINVSSNIGITVSSFVPLCRQDSLSGEGYVRCEMGKIYASGKVVE
jgi:hypothetical protein